MFNEEKFDVTFRHQSERFLCTAQNRRNSPVKAATVRAYQSHINKMLPLLANVPLSGIRNGIAKELIEKLTADGLQPASINAIFTVLKMIVASAVNEEGDALFPVVWNHDFIDLPSVKIGDQDAPNISVEAVQNAIRVARSGDKAFYALLAGTGLRVGEALSIKVLTGGTNDKDSTYCPKTGLITVRTTVSGGRVQYSTKTKAGVRQIDISDELRKYINENLQPTPGQFLFTSDTQGIVRIKTAYETLVKNGIKDGFHCFRRFRITHLESVGVPRGLAMYWTGHGAKDVHEGYIKMENNLRLRQDWAEKSGLGFDL